MFESKNIRLKRNVRSSVVKLGKNQQLKAHLHAKIIIQILQPKHFLSWYQKNYFCIFGMKNELK